MAGTLKADKWRTLGTIYLPIALISWWGEGTPHASAEEAAHFLQVLKHTMCLISVVIIASKHFVSPLHSSGYLKQMSRYLSNLQTIHPSANFCPYHHLSLHLPYFFHLFGPSRCFWTYPFERLIGRIQRLLSNHKIGMLGRPRYATWLIVFSRSNGVNSPDLVSEGVKDQTMARQSTSAFNRSRDTITIWPYLYTQQRWHCRHNEWWRQASDSGSCWTCYSQRSSASTLSRRYRNPPPGQIEARGRHLLDIQDPRRQ